MKHLLKLADLSAKEITELLNLADQLKYEKKHGIEHHLLKGKNARNDISEIINKDARFI